MPSPNRTQTHINTERRTRALALRVANIPYHQIATQLGYASPAAVHNDLQRALQTRKRAHDEQANLLAYLEAEKLDTAERKVWEVLHRRHIIVSQGRVVLDINGQEMVDDDVTLRAALALIRISESRRRLLGLDAPTQTQQEVTHHVDAYAAEIAQLMADMATSGSGPVAGHPEVFALEAGGPPGAAATGR